MLKHAEGDCVRHDHGAAAGTFYTPAFAIVYNRGAAAEAETFDPHKTSTVYEADIIRDLFQGLVMHNRRRTSFQAPPKAGPYPMTVPSTRSSCARMASGRMAAR